VAARGSTDELDEVVAELASSSWMRKADALRRAATHVAAAELDDARRSRLAVAIVEVAADSKWEVRKAAAVALAECPPLEAVERALDVLTHDANHWVSHAAERAVYRRRARVESAHEWTLSTDSRDPTLQHIAARIREIGLSSMTPARVYELAMEISEQAYRELAADTAHEIRTLLMPLDGYLADLARRLGSDPTAQRLHASARDRLQQIQLFVTSLRDYSAPGEDAFSTVELADVLRDAVALGAESAGATVTRHVDAPEGLVIEAMRERLTRALTNLVSNSCHAMERGGVLNVRARSTGPDWVEIAVQDTGCGMSPEMIEQARLRFRTTRRDRGGTGLGLPIAERIVVHDHHGELLIDSELGEGTTVTIHLPIRRANG
jgi:signal transduction histidine kinase